MGWWPWKKKTTRMCPSGHAMEASWLSCPHCPAPTPRAEVSAPVSRRSGRDVAGTQKLNRPPVVAWLIALNGKHQGEDFRIVEGKNKVGKLADCQVVLTDDGVSSEHALISYDGADKHFLITDLASLNGTFVYEGGEYKKINSRELLDNDTIKFGETQFRFKCVG